MSSDDHGQTQDGLNAELRDAAFVAANGECAWELEDAIAALDWLSRQGYAVLGGEAWAFWADGSYGGVLPPRGGGTPFVDGWASRPREAAKPGLLTARFVAIMASQH